MRNFLLLFVSCLVAQAAWSQPGWTRLESPVNVEFRSGFYLDDEHAIVVGEKGTIIRTADAGEHWVGVQDNEWGFLWTAGYKRGGNFAIAGGEKGLLMSSVDFGETWKEIPTGLGAGSFIFGCQVIDENNFYVCGGKPPGSGVVLKTTNGGKDWTTMTIDDVFFLERVVFLNEQLGFTGGSTATGGGKLFKTTDAGASWTTIYETDTGFVSTIQCLSESQIHLAITSLADAGMLVRTTNGGATWEEQFIDDHQVTGSFFYDAEHGLAYGSALLMTTSNAGVVWTDIGFEDLESINDIQGTKDRLLAVGTGGTLLQYSMPAGVDARSGATLVFTYPSPATDRVHIVLPEGRAKLVTVYDVLGRCVTLVQTNEGKITLGRATLGKGSYYYTILCDGKTYKGSFVFQ